MGLLMRSPPVDLSSESIYYLRSRRSQAAVGNARSTCLVVLVKSASMGPRPEARCPAGALFTGVRGIGILRTSPSGHSRKLDSHFTEFSEVRLLRILGSSHNSRSTKFGLTIGPVLCAIHPSSWNGHSRK